MHSKHSIREEFKAIRARVKPTPSIQANILLHFKRLLEEHVPLEDNIVVGAYHSTKEEIDLSPVISWLHEQKIICALPKIKSYQTRDMDFLLFQPHTQVTKNKIGIHEPCNSDIVIPNILILPLLACDLKGNRLGYGLGYYDKYLAKAKEINKEIITIGICHEDQISKETLPTEPHDQKLDFVVTDRLIYNTKPHK